MNEETAGWPSALADTERKKGAVLVMDALGVKGSWARSSPVQLLTSWRKVVSVAELTAKVMREELSQNSRRFGEPERSAGEEPMIGDCRFQAMSDTFVLVVQPTPKDESLFAALWWVSIFARDIFVAALETGIYFRGVMSCGEFYGSPDEKLMIGPAVDEAVEWYTKPDWIGVSTAPSAFFLAEQRLLSGRNRSRNPDPLTKWNVPMRGGANAESWVIDWPCSGMPGGTAGEAAPDEEQLLGYFAAKPIGHDALAKYTNTLAFFRSRLASRQEQTTPAASTPD
jgi:hypothetical protein